MIESLSVAQILLDAQLQTRMGINSEVVEEYAERLKQGDQLPAGHLFRDETGVNRLVDGWHRLLAHQKAGRTHMEFVVHDGGMEEAQWFAVTTNADHGLPRSREDKHRIVQMALAHPRAEGMSLREVARHCKVSFYLVSQIATPKSVKDELDELDEAIVRAPTEEPTEPKQAKESAKSKPRREVSTKDEALLDPDGHPVPAQLRDVFADSWLRKTEEGLTGIIDQLVSLNVAHGVRNRAVSLPYLDVDSIDTYKRVVEDLEALASLLEAAIPYALCPKCVGKKCGECRHGGIVPAWRYDELRSQCHDAA